MRYDHQSEEHLFTLKKKDTHAKKWLVFHALQIYAGGKLKLGLSYITSIQHGIHR